NRAEKLELLQRSPRAVCVGNRDQRVEADRHQSPDFAAFDRVEHFARAQPLLRQFGFRDAPEVSDEAAMVRVVDVASAGELIAALSMLATALAVALTGDCAVTAARFADAARRQNQVDVTENIFDTLGVVLDAARVEPHRSSGGSPDFRRLYDAARGNACDAFCGSRVVFSDEVANSIEVVRVLADECLVNPAAFNQHVQNA